MIPRQILIILTDDVVDLCKAGDDAIITGTVIQRWSPLTKGVRCEIELAIVANNVLVSDWGCCANDTIWTLAVEYEAFQCDFELINLYRLKGMNYLWKVGQFCGS